MRAEGVHAKKCRQAHAGLYQEAQRLVPMVQALADRERALEAENAELRRLLKQSVSLTNRGINLLRKL